MVNNLNIETQIKLLHSLPHRNTLLSKEFNPKIILNINVVRNEAIEITLKLVDRYLTNFGIQVNWNLGPYDDTLTLLEFVDPVADATLIWIDWRRISIKEHKFLLQRVDKLKTQLSPQPVLVLAPLEGDLRNSADLVQQLMDLGQIRVIENQDLTKDVRWREPRLKERNGTDLSNQGSLLIAQALGLQALPEIVLPTLKCLIIDLDNTIYQGVLGESGILGIKINQDHLNLGREIKRLKDQGIFIAIASKNHEADVEELFEVRNDLPVSRSDISIVKANWNLKSQSIIEIATELNIGLDSIAFLDDNPSEISEVSSSLSEVYAMFAPNPRASARLLKIGPRTSSFTKDSTHGLRQEDASMNKKRRQTAIRLGDPLTLHQSLETKLKIQLGDLVDFERAEDLFSRTNQFNLSLKRTKVNLNELNKGNKFLATASLEDKFSDSGVIAAIHGQIVENQILVDEFVISCRALGRNLESAIFYELLVGVMELKTISSSQFLIEWKKGPRNLPSLNWLTKDLHVSINGEDGIERLELAVIPNNIDLKKQLTKGD
jgi:FkbH-like protein